MCTAKVPKFERDLLSVPELAATYLSRNMVLLHLQSINVPSREFEPSSSWNIKTTAITLWLGLIRITIQPEPISQQPTAMIIIKEPAPVVCPHCDVEVLSFDRENEGGDSIMYCPHVAFYFDESFLIQFPESLDKYLLDRIMADAGIGTSSDQGFASNEAMLKAMFNLEGKGYTCIESQPASGFGMVAWLVFLPKLD